MFADEKWLEILDNHFPEILEPNLDKTIIDIKPNLNAAGRQALWSKGYSTGMTKVNGKIIRSPGIGRATSGHSVLVVKTANEILRWINTLTKHFSTYRLEICKHYKLNPSKAVFKVQFGKTTLEVIDLATGTSILTFPHIFNI